MEKALVLLSGGLDSRLACKILQEKYKVTAMFFLLPFTGGCCKDKFCVFKFCQKQGIKLEIDDCTKGKLFREYMELLRKPKHGRGTALNPCRDCHIFMFKKAKQYADKNKIKIIATGEVLDQRPLSQTEKALKIIDEELGFKVTRPLIELGIHGRQRKQQIALASKYQIDYPSPGGGCLLCEREYCKKLKLVLDNPNLSYNDIQLLSIGRHFLSSQVILGKNHQENLLLEKQSGIKLIPEQPGPTALVKSKELVNQAKELIQKYSKHKILKFKTKN
ncbi:MAG: hypothetical protein NT076_05740 [Candidatus Pacearchaeota archaeon]|nr:hypothetical protein [Candidatus Pacearchaeota archaeon]